jgi:hypothetical protein
VSQMSREYLVSVGLQVVLPPVAVGAVYFLGRIARPGNEPPPTTHQWHKLWWLERPKRNISAWTLVLSVPLVYAVFLLPNGYSKDDPDHSDSVVGALLVVAVGTIAFVQAAAISLRARIAHVSGTEEKPEERYNKPVTMGAVSLVLAGACLPTALFFVSSVPPLQARVCPREPTQALSQRSADVSKKPDRDLAGALVAETGKRVYLISSRDSHRVVSIPNGRIGAVLISREPIDLAEDCPNVPP